MQKIPSLFVRPHGNGQKFVINEVNPKCQWVIDGEGVATRKFDGTCCLVRDGKLYRRRECKIGGKIPDDFEECERDETTGKIFGWVPVDPMNPECRYHAEAWKYHSLDNKPLTNGTYELCGPKVQGNPERFLIHALVKHGQEQLPECPRTFEGVRGYLLGVNYEGIVWHHPDGRMAKIKKRDFE